MNSPVTVKGCAEVRIDFELKRGSLYHPAYFFLGSDLKGYKTKQYEAAPYAEYSVSLVKNMR